MNTQKFLAVSAPPELPSSTTGDTTGHGFPVLTVSFNKREGMPSVRICQNRYGNWSGYVGRRCMGRFGETSTMTQEENAQLWLRETYKYYNREMVIP